MDAAQVAPTPTAIVLRMSFSKLAANLLAATSLAALAGCPSGGAAKKIRSEQPTMAPKSKVVAEQCDLGKSYDSLIVDWDPEVRGDLEVAMKEGVAVVAYDCNSIQLLPDCSIEGNYGFIGMTRKEKVVSMKDSDEVKANLPMSGVSFLAKLGGEMKRGTTLDAAMIMIGKKNSARKRASRDELEEDCSNATHFVRSATLGAFVLATSTAAEGKVAANFFGDQGAGTGSASAESIHNKDGDIKNCETAKPDATSAPAQCGAPLRLSLKAIKEGSAPVPSEAIAEVEVPSCPPGFVLTEDGCENPQADTPYQCELGDSSTCQAQCDKGNAGSCYILGTMLRDGVGSTKDWKRAATLLAKACKADDAEACRAAGTMFAAGQGVKADTKAAQTMLKSSCDGGDALGCVELGKLMLTDKKLNAGDAQFVFRKACYGGEFEGCTWLGNMRQQGLGGMKSNAKIANKFYEKGCKEGSAQACYKLGLNTAAGQGTQKNKPKATELIDRACQAGHQPACSNR